MKKELEDTVKERMKTPYFGYSILAFISINWQPFFILLLSEDSPQDRLNTFNSSTHFFFLYILPFIIGFTVAYITPYLKQYFAQLHKKPIQALETIDLEAESYRIAIQAQLEKSRAEKSAVEEKEIINRAKIDQEIDNIKDDKTKKKVEEEIKEVRRNTEISKSILGARQIALHNQFSNLEQMYLDIIANNHPNKNPIDIKLIVQKMIKDTDLLLIDVNELGNKIFIQRVSNLKSNLRKLDLYS